MNTTTDTKKASHENKSSKDLKIHSDKNSKNLEEEGQEDKESSAPKQQPGQSPPR